MVGRMGLQVPRAILELCVQSPRRQWWGCAHSCGRDSGSGDQQLHCGKGLRETPLSLAKGPETASCRSARLAAPGEGDLGVSVWVSLDERHM